MPYFHDKELFQYVERDLIPGLVDDCVAEFYERFSISLDISPKSLSQIDGVIAAHAGKLERDTMAGTLGAYLGMVLCCSDGARWNASFNRDAGVDGYRSSRVKIYNQEVDVFSLADQALAGSQTLDESFRLLHRPVPRSRKRKAA